MFSRLLALLPCVLGAYSLSAVLASEVMLRHIDAAGLPVTLHDRLQVLRHDLLGLAPLYLPRTTVALLGAMVLATVLALISAKSGKSDLRWLQASIHIACGASAMILMHLFVREHDPVHALGVVFGAGGLLLQGVAGGFGAYLFFVATGQAHR